MKASQPEDSEFLDEYTTCPLLIMLAKHAVPIAECLSNTVAFAGRIRSKFSLPYWRCNMRIGSAYRSNSIWCQREKERNDYANFSLPWWLCLFTEL